MQTNTNGGLAQYEKKKKNLNQIKIAFSFFLCLHQYTCTQETLVETTKNELDNLSLWESDILEFCCFWSHHKK